MFETIARWLLGIDRLERQNAGLRTKVDELKQKKADLERAKLSDAARAQDAAACGGRRKTCVNIEVDGRRAGDTEPCRG